MWKAVRGLGRIPYRESVSEGLNSVERQSWTTTIVEPISVSEGLNSVESRAVLSLNRDSPMFQKD